MRYAGDAGDAGDAGVEEMKTINVEYEGQYEGAGERALVSREINDRVQSVIDNIWI
jgi:hypothetical protein